MADPLSVVVFAAVAGGAAGSAAGKMLERAWDASEKWIAAYFANHRPKAQEAARVNSANYLREVGDRIVDAEATGTLDRETIESAMDQPDFAALLQDTVVNAARTDSAAKHKILAALIAERLACNDDSAFSVAVRLAAEAVSLSTTTQLHVIGFIATVRVIRPTEILSDSEFSAWLVTRFKPFESLDFTRFALMHLEALDCVREHTERADLREIINSKIRGHVPADGFLGSSLGKHVAARWKQYKLGACSPTSIGLIVGLQVADELTGAKTAIDIWG